MPLSIGSGGNIETHSVANYYKDSECMKPICKDSTLFQPSQHGREMSSIDSMQYTVYQRYLTLSQTGNDVTSHIWAWAKLMLMGTFCV